MLQRHQLATSMACVGVRYPDTRSFGTLADAKEQWDLVGKPVLKRDGSCGGLGRDSIVNELHRRRRYEEGLMRFVRDRRDCRATRRPLRGHLSCKRLIWVTGINAHGTCAGRLADDYAAALGSARRHATFLRPVLVLMGNGSRAELLHSWAERAGVRVLRVGKLSFQESLQAGSGIGVTDCVAGSFLRIDVPRLLLARRDILEEPGVRRAPPGARLRGRRDCAPACHVLRECEHRLPRDHLPVCPPQVCADMQAGSGSAGSRTGGVHVLYTDADVLFARPLQLADIAGDVPDPRRRQWASYGAEVKRDGVPLNVGVMLLELRGFEAALDAFHDFGARRRYRFPVDAGTLDQGWFNAYFAGVPAEGAPAAAAQAPSLTSAREDARAVGAAGEAASRERPGRPGRACLRNAWNWKVYWGNGTAAAAETVVADTINLVHFHGPKPRRDLWLPCMARPAPRRCPIELGGASRSRPELAAHPFMLLLAIGIASDRGRFAQKALTAYSSFLAASGWLGASSRGTTRGRGRARRGSGGIPSRTS